MKRQIEKRTESLKLNCKADRSVGRIKMHLFKVISEHFLLLDNKIFFERDSRLKTNESKYSKSCPKIINCSSPAFNFRVFSFVFWYCRLSKVGLTSKFEAHFNGAKKV